MYVLSSNSSNIPDCHPLSSRTCRLTRCHKTGPFIFLDISTLEGDEEEEEEDVHTKVCKMFHFYSSSTCCTLTFLGCTLAPQNHYEDQQPATTLGSSTSPGSQHLALFHFHKVCLYKVDFPLSKYPFLVS